MHYFQLFIGLILFSSFLKAQEPFYFPLNEGDRWYYTATQDPMIRTLENPGDTLLVNGHRYFHTWEYYRQQGDSVFKIDTWNNYEHLVFNFAAQEGDTIYQKVFSPDTFVVILTNILISNGYLGDNRRVYSFISKTTGFNEHGTYYSVMDSIGIVSYGDFIAGGITVLGAEINGQEYGTITAVEPEIAIYPTEAILHQNYPNPFNPITTISYSLSSAADVTLSIYDLSGRKITTRVNSIQQAGEYRINWNAENAASGVYVYQLRTGDMVQQKKCILLK
ncbi:MAG: T9SS type A sorting domain-containing protein, partial [Calditrichota bacterium]